jgi:phosphoglycerate dehydrogenase-like enzyme
MTAGRLRAVVAAPLSDADASRIVALEPRIDLIREPALLPPMRHAADFSGDPGFHRTAEQQRAFENLIDSADILYGIPDVDPAALARTVRANPLLRWVHTMAAGGGAQVSAADLTAAELTRVAFTTSAGVHGGPLAEFAVFGVFAGAKDLPRLSAQKSAHEWTGRWIMRQISDLTVLVLGLGGIGTETARKLSGLGAHVIAFNRSGEGSIDGVVVKPIDQLSEHLPQADAVVVTLPGTASTEGLLDDRFFAALRPGATIVNVGRGTVIDEPALLRALDSGRVGFAALDVFAVEPLDAVSGLWDHPNVVISPHTAALDPREESRIAALFADNAGRLLDGRPMRNVVDTVEFY